MNNSRTNNSSFSDRIRNVSETFSNTYDKGRSAIKGQLDNLSNKAKNTYGKIRNSTNDKLRSS